MIADANRGFASCLAAVGPPGRDLRPGGPLCIASGRVLHEADHVHAGVLSPVVSVDIGDAKALTLEVDYGANYDVQDRFNWIEPALLKKKPATQAAPAATPAEPVVP